MTAYRQGMELREGRWCSKRDMDRLRREADADGSAAIDDFLRAQERCGHPIWDEHDLVVKYILKRAEEHFKTDSLPRNDEGITVGPEVFVEAAKISVVIRPWGGGRHAASRRGKMVQYEIMALLEWRHPTRGWTFSIAPGEPYSDWARRFIVKDYDETESVVYAKDLTHIIDPNLAQLRSWLTKRFKYYGRLHKKTR